MVASNTWRSALGGSDGHTALRMKRNRNKQQLRDEFILIPANKTPKKMCSFCAVFPQKSAKNSKTAIFVFFCELLASLMTMSGKVLFDCDPTLYGFRDIDDSLALLYLLSKHRRGKIGLVGVTTVFGNDSVENTYRTARNILARAKLIREIPVIKGASSRHDIHNDSSRFIMQALNSGKIEYVLATGPLTNIALAIKDVDKDILSKVTIIIMGGALDTLGNTPVLKAEFNFYKDPIAADIVLKTSWRKIILVPLDVTKRAKIPFFWIRKLEEKCRDKTVRYVLRGTFRWALINTLVFGGFNPHDLLTAWIFINMESLRYFEEQIMVDTYRIPGMILRKDRGSRILVPIIDKFDRFYREVIRELSHASITQL